MLFLGIVEVALFAPLHETTHDTPFRTPALNRLVGLVAGFVLVLPPHGFRLFHRAHHRYVQDPARDPELLGSRPPGLTDYVWRLSGLPYWGAQFRSLIVTASGQVNQPWIPTGERQAVIREARAYLVAYVLVGILAAYSVLPWLWWIVPVLLGQPVLRYILMAEHGARPLTADPWSNTRTTRAGALIRLLFWNANYHAEHHLIAAVPFHALPALHALVAARLRGIAASYPAAHREIRNAAGSSG